VTENGVRPNPNRLDPVLGTPTQHHKGNEKDGPDLPSLQFFPKHHCLSSSAKYNFNLKSSLDNRLFRYRKVQIPSKSPHLLM
jgi:hypothetical protein